MFSPTTPKILFIACLLAPIAASRVKVRSEHETSNRWAQCTLTGPEKSGFELTIPQQVSGPKGGSCTFACKRLLWELNSVMSRMFQATEDGHKCNCFLTGQENAHFDEDMSITEDTWFYRFTASKRLGAVCSPDSCWERYQKLMNFKKPKDELVSVHNQHHFEVSCDECDSEEDCSYHLKLPTFKPPSTKKPRKNAKPIVKTPEEKDMEKFIKDMGISLPDEKKKGPKKPTWLFGESGQSCTEVCDDWAGECVEAQWPTTLEQFKEIAAETEQECPDTQLIVPNMASLGPVKMGDVDQCFHSGPASAPDCEAAAPDAFRFCPCSDGGYESWDQNSVDKDSAFDKGDFGEDNLDDFDGFGDDVIYDDDNENTVKPKVSKDELAGHVD